MKPKWLGGALLTVMFCASGSASAYCAGSDTLSPVYDPHYYSLSYEFNRTEYVVIGRVLGATPLDDDGKPASKAGAGTFYDVQVERAFKGSPGKRLRIYSENSTGRFRMTIGIDYLLFVSFGRFDVVGDQYTVDSCGNSATIEAAGRKLQNIEKLSSKQ